MKRGFGLVVTQAILRPAQPPVQEKAPEFPADWRIVRCTDGDWCVLSPRLDTTYFSDSDKMKALDKAVIFVKAMISGKHCEPHQAELFDAV